MVIVRGVLGKCLIHVHMLRDWVVGGLASGRGNLPTEKLCVSVLMHVYIHVHVYIISMLCTSTHVLYAQSCKSKNTF